MNKNSEHDEYVELIRKSFKKLKSAIFFDKTQLVLRDKLIMYETSPNFESNLNTLANKMMSADWQEIIESINVQSFPKKIVHNEKIDLDEKDDTRLITNVVSKKTEISEIQCFIDMNVEGHILGVAWLLVIGYKIDGKIYEHSYGNRLRKNLVDTSGKATYSPYLFEPYFQQYESWRDKGIQNAQKSLSKNQDVVVLMLDFKRFFYQVNISEDELKNCVKETLEDASSSFPQHKKNNSEQLTDFVWKVIEKYSQKIRYLYPDLVDTRNVLPIGFLPSNVLANYALKKFDDSIINGWNPIYYGRYVDDIILVEKIEKNSYIYQSAQEGKLTANDVIEYYLTNCNTWLRSDCLCEKNAHNGLIKPTSDRIYTVNPAFNQFSESKIEVQNNKVKIFYFNSAESDALLTCFREHLRKNKSEFRFLPEDESVFQRDDYSEIYSLKNKSDGPNKLRDISGIGIDKFMLSKYLGKYTRISGLVNDQSEHHFENDIEKIFTYQAIIENYILWEKVLEIFVINNRYDAIVNFLKKVTIAIENMVYQKQKNEQNNSERTIKELQKTLQNVLYSSVYRALSLVWGNEISILQDNIYKECNELPGFDPDTMREMRKGYCKTRMCDKYAIVVPVDCFLNASKLFVDMQSVNLTDFSAIKDLEFDSDWLKSDVYKYYPFLMTMNDLGILYQLMCIKDKKNTEDFAESTIISDIFDLKKQYIRLNYLVNSSPNNIDSVLEGKKFERNEKKHNLIRVTSKQLEKVKIAVGNTMLFESDFDKVLMDLPNRQYPRYNRLQKVVNEAIAQKADLLVLPEGYLPFEWLPILTRTCAKNQMAVVTGVEHLKVKNATGKSTVSNLTAVILPFVEGDYKFSYVHFHNKVHLAPHEKEKIESYHCIPNKGNSYELYDWNDFWFSVYCCYELTSIYDRSLFQAYADAVIAVEWNKDTNYYSNIVESLSRDLHCFCIQVNTSEFGDSRITTPSKTEAKDLLKVKGGKNPTILIDTIDIADLRNFQLKGQYLQEKSADVKKYKPTPPDFDYKIVNQKIHHSLWKNLK